MGSTLGLWRPATERTRSHEMQKLKGQGHIGFKAKAGGVSLAEDMKWLEVVRDVIGSDNDLDDRCQSRLGPRDGH